MERKRLLYLVLAAFLASLSLLLAVLTGLQGKKAMAAQLPAANGVLATIAPRQEVITHTIYLPLVMRSPYAQPFGITMYGAVDDAAGLQVMEDAGCKWVVTVFSWAVTEPSPPVGGAHTYNWSSFDTKVANAKAAGMAVFAIFHDNPSWAAALPGGPVYDNHVQDLVYMVTAMAERYDCDGFQDAPGSPCVHDWSFYGESDNGSLTQAQKGWGYWGHNGAGYAAMLARVSPAIHAADPRVKVLIGGLAYDWFEEEGGPFVRSFLPNVLSTLNAYPGGARAYIDGIGFHFYPISPGRWPTIREKALEVRGIMGAYGVGDLLLTCPEMGYWSSYKHDNSSESQQAARLVQMYTRGLSVGVLPLAWYKVFDQVVAGSAGDTEAIYTCGLLRLDGNLKPSYYAYKTLAHELSAGSYVRTMDVPGIEGYVFRMANGREKTVLWATEEATTVLFPYTQLRLVDVDGDERILIGGQGMRAGKEGVSGHTAIRVYQNSVLYVEPYP